MTHPEPRHIAPLLLLASLGCAAAGPGDATDGPDDVAFAGGKADESGYQACALDAVVRFLNGGVSADAMRALGVHARAARGLAGARDGADGAFGTADDRPFADILAVDAVPYVGPVAIDQLVLAAGGCAEPAPASGVEVIFSPQPFETSHLARAIALIDGAERSLDVAMYSMSDGRVQAALRRASERGVSIRLLLDGASADRVSPEGTLSARMEDAGIDVRWINKIMHHKLVLVDGPRDDRAAADTAWLMTGSGNWSSSAGSRYDENTLVVHGNRELSLRYQREFDHLWAHSRDFAWNPDLVFFESRPVTEDEIPDDPTVDAAFTSANFRTSVSSRYGETFSAIRGMDTVADRIVALIQGAQSSIRIASGHLRSRKISEALLARAADPDLDIRIYLDGQEFLSAWSHQDQTRELAACLEAAGSSEARTQDCYDKGFMYAYAMVQAGIPVRFKHYAYRWHYAYAPQMHHKYIVVDGRFVLTGSYNQSDNAEHNTMENVVLLDGAAYPDVADAYVANFDRMWETGRAEGLYEAVLADVEEGTDPFPIVYDAMALEWHEVDALKRAIRSRCPQVESMEFREAPETHFVCDPAAP